MISFHTILLTPEAIRARIECIFGFVVQRFRLQRRQFTRIFCLFWIRYSDFPHFQLICSELRFAYRQFRYLFLRWKYFWNGTNPALKYSDSRCFRTAPNCTTEAFLLYILCGAWFDYHIWTKARLEGARNGIPLR